MVYWVYERSFLQHLQNRKYSVHDLCSIPCSPIPERTLKPLSSSQFPLLISLDIAVAIHMPKSPNVHSYLLVHD